MQLTHKIALSPSISQAEYFKKAAGTARLTWNWGLDEWQKDYSKGNKPNAMALKKRFNAIKYEKYPWLHEMHRDCHAQPFAYLAKAWKRFFNDVKAKKPANQPQFKKRGRCKDAFYVANDKFAVKETQVKLPKLGWVNMTESLRFEGKILGATVSRTADKWFIAIQVDVPEHKANRCRTGNNIVGVDFGITSVATLSTGEKVVAPKPLKSLLRRLRIRGRALSRKYESAKSTGIKPVPLSNNHKKSSLRLAKLHAHIVNQRVDFNHKLTTRLCRENQTIIIEDLHIAGMMKNEKLARAVSDVGLGTLRRFIEYKALRYNNRLIIADRWYASSKICSHCDWKNDVLKWSDRTWQCRECKTVHDRDVNASRNLKRLATATALPVANALVIQHTKIEVTSILGGKVTPVRHECGQQDTSGQEKNREHICSLF